MALPHNWTADDILALSLAKIKSTVVRRVVEQYPSLANAIAASPEELAEHGIADNSLFPKMVPRRRKGLEINRVKKK